LLFIGAIAGMILVPPKVRADELREDCIAFNPDKSEVKQIQARWKLVEGSHWILDLGREKVEADQSFKIIKKYSFDSICFVGRQDPSMTYFSCRDAIQAYDNTQNLAQLIRAGYAGKSPLVASHAVMVEQIIQALGAGLVPPVNEEFNNFFIVSIPPYGTPKVIRTKYETWSAILSEMNCNG